jgi:UDP-glucose 4-epimerase
VIPRMIIRAMNREPLIVFGEGNQIRDFLYVGDAVKAILALLDSPDAKGEIFNYGSRTETSILQIAQQICHHFRLPPETGIQKLPMRPGDSAKVVCDHTKFKAKLGFGPETGLDEGLRMTIQWFESLPYPREKLLSDVSIKNWE